MRVLIFNGSPRMKRSNTERILNPFIEGLKETGAEVGHVYLRRLNIQPCNGCLSCWLRTPGQCAINDDINILREKFMETDVFILATPIYLFSSSGYLKMLTERLFFPFTLPEYLLMDDKVYHPIRFPERKWKSLLIANGAFDGEDVFKPLIDMYERMMHNVVDEEGKSAFVSLGNITIGFGELFADTDVKCNYNKFHEVMKMAGRELGLQGSISNETLKLASRPLYFYAGMDRTQAIERNNQLIEEYKRKFKLLDMIKGANS